jgi:hypothetical protein
MTTPVYSSSTSITTSSIGSSVWPFSSARQHLRARERKFEAFAAHGFDQHAELQFAAAGDFVSVAVAPVSVTRMATLPSASREQAVADHAALHLVAFAAGERANR